MVKYSRNLELPRPDPETGSIPAISGIPAARARAGGRGEGQEENRNPIPDSRIEAGWDLAFRCLAVSKDARGWNFRLSVIDATDRKSVPSVPYENHP